MNFEDSTGRLKLTLVNKDRLQRMKNQSNDNTKLVSVSDIFLVKIMI